jgi:hypothetical protein
MPPPFTFVTISTPDDARSKSVRQVVRSQALRHYHSRRIHDRRSTTEFELDVSHLLDRTQANPEYVPTGDEPETSTEMLPLERHASININLLDPLFQFPFPVTDRARMLYSHRKF